MIEYLTITEIIEMSYTKVLGIDGLVRDNSSGAIINTNDKARAAYLAKRKAAEIQQLEKRNMQNQIAVLEQRVNDIDNKLDTIINILKNSTV
jgi:predicted  nucleic acid-binding Zn-ribbon protein